MTFTQWLLNTRHRTIIRDLVGDMRGDSGWPSTATEKQVFLDYLRSKNACDGAIEALNNAWRLYGRSQRGAE